MAGELNTAAMHPTREDADVVSSSDDYATRFAGEVGAYLLSVQSGLTLELLRPWPGASVLDVGGGHNQLAPPLRQAGYRVSILGSQASCATRPRRMFTTDEVPFIVGDLIEPPLPDKSYDVVLAFRLMAHVHDWRAMLRGLCRVARHAVVVDFATPSSVNILGRQLFSLKQKVERNTRQYRTIARSDVEEAFGEYGYRHSVARGQFTLPMALHRLAKRPGVSRGAEAALRSVGLTDRVGSPLILRATREAA